jgi:hypothetical protein
MNLTKRQQLLAIAAITAVALLAADRLVFSPLVKTWKARSDQLATLKKNVTQGRALFDRDTAIRERWDTMRTNTLPSEVSAAEGRVLNGFDRWSRESRVTITSIRPQWKRAASDYAALECRVDAAGSLSALTRFLYDLERDPLGLKVESLELTARDDNGEQLTLGLQVSALLLNPPSTPSRR